LPHRARRGSVLALGLLVAWANASVLAQRPGRDLSGEWAPRFHEDQPERIPGPEIGGEPDAAKWRPTPCTAK
jgi:hypothetical protein